MIRRCLATSCTLIALTWASLGVARFPLEAPARLPAATERAAPVRTAVVVAIGALSGLAAIGFGRDRRWQKQA